MRRDPLSEHTLRRFRDEADRAAQSNHEGRAILAGHGIAWDDAGAAWARLHPHGGQLDDRIPVHWRDRYRATCATLSSG